MLVDLFIYLKEGEMKRSLYAALALCMVLGGCGKNESSSQLDSTAEVSSVQTTQSSSKEDVKSEKTYIIRVSYLEPEVTITDEKTITEIDNWVSKVLEVCEDYRLEDGDYPAVGGTEGFIIKTEDDVYEKMYFVTTTKLDLSLYTEKNYVHQQNFSWNYVSYELPDEYIDEICEIVNL